MHRQELFLRYAGEPVNYDQFIHRVSVTDFVAIHFLYIIMISFLSLNGWEIENPYNIPFPRDERLKQHEHETLKVVFRT